MGFLSFFQRAPSPDYETLLSQLESKIQSRQAHLQQIQKRERRANALFISYGLGTWLVYTLLWYFHVFNQTAVTGLPVLGGPVLVFFTRRVFRWWYNRKKENEEAHLAELKKQQRDKVEELKKKTGYYSTRNLLEKYDELIKKNAEARGQKLSVGPGNVPGQPPMRPASAGPLAGPNQLHAFPSSSPMRPSASATNSPRPGTPTGPTPPQQLALQTDFPRPPPPAPYQRTVVDKIADALLGVPADDPNTKYALICANCYTHNGLVTKEQWDTIQYRCMACHFFNPSRSGPATPPQSPSAAALGHRRRVQSMHHLPPASSLGRPEGAQHAQQRSVSGPSRHEPSVAEEGSEDEDEDDSDAAVEKSVLMAAKAEEPKARRRTAKKNDDEDAMETD